MRYLPILLFLVLLSCQEVSKQQEAIAEVKVDMEFVRFDRMFARATPESLKDLKSAFPQFFPAQFADSIWLSRMADTLQLELNRAVVEVFPENEVLEGEFYSLYQHARYYFPEIPLPPVYTVISDVDYQNPVIYSERALVIGLDNYLGTDHPFYASIPRYIALNMRPEQVLPQATDVLVKTQVPPPGDRSFLAGMIYHGKRLYAESLLLPELPTYSLLGYSAEQWEWSAENEVEIWRYFIENELLYSTDPKLYPRFLNKAPFSKFYLEIDNESPGEIGRYIGFRIVSTFMERSDDTTLQDMLMMGHDELYRSSGFKPSK